MLDRLIDSFLKGLLLGLVIIILGFSAGGIYQDWSAARKEKNDQRIEQAQLQAARQDALNRINKFIADVPKATWTKETSEFMNDEVYWRLRYADHYAATNRDGAIATYASIDLSGAKRTQLCERKMTMTSNERVSFFGLTWVPRKGTSPELASQHCSKMGPQTVVVEEEDLYFKPGANSDGARGTSIGANAKAVQGGVN